MFRVLTPTGYAAVITAVAIEFDYPKVAALVAPEVGEYTHECVVCARSETLNRRQEGGSEEVLGNDSF